MQSLLYKLHKPTISVASRMLRPTTVKLGYNGYGYIGFQTLDTPIGPDGQMSLEYRQLYPIFDTINLGYIGSLGTDIFIWYTVSEIRYKWWHFNEIRPVRYIRVRYIRGFLDNFDSDRSDIYEFHFSSIETTIVELLLWSCDGGHCEKWPPRLCCVFHLVTLTTHASPWGCGDGGSPDSQLWIFTISRRISANPLYGPSVWPSFTNPTSQYYIPLSSHLNIPFLCLVGSTQFHSLFSEKRTICV